jgi:hypothetical protein
MPILKRPRFARQDVREQQIQTAHDRVLLVFAVLGRPGGRPEAGAADDERQLRIFVSSILRFFVVAVGTCQRDSEGC